MNPILAVFADLLLVFLILLGPLFLLIWFAGGFMDVICGDDDG